jgi:UDP-2,3-diacylglucosamine pyrophosphatase LpxH
MAETYHLKFVWQEKDGRFKVVYCDEADVPVDAKGFPYAFWRLPQFLVDDYYLQWKKNEISANFEILNGYAAAVTVNKKQLVRFPKGSFLYMDVGRWLDGKQSFGLVCGDQAVLCDYNPPDSPANLNRADGKLLDAVLGIPGVTVRSRKKIFGPHPPDDEHLLVIVPDMHVPMAPPLNMARPLNLEGYGPSKVGYWRNDPNTFDYFGRYDFFNSRASIRAMIAFLKALRARIPSDNVAFVQIGDMYELWAGHSLEYVETDEKHPAVKLKSPRSAETVGTWIAMIHDMHDELFEQFDACNREMLTMYLHGNHDSYLSCQEVVTAANKEIESRCQTELWDGSKREVFKKTTVARRLREVNFLGVFLEHGQRADKANRDGETEGQQRTNEAFESLGMWKKKVGDTTRRRSFVTGAAAQWMVRGQDFGLYVMGHTHDPELKYVEVVHVQGSISYSGGKVLIQATNEL